MAAKSKFFGGSSSSSDTESSESDDDQPVAAVSQPIRTGRKWADESSSEEEMVQRRVVKKQSDRRYDQMVDKIVQLKNHQKNYDFASLITDYETICKMYEKLRGINQQDESPPPQFIKALTSMEDYVEKLHAEHVEKKQNTGEKLTESKQRAFNTLRAKVRKGNRTYKDEIDHCKDHPSEFESGDDSDDDQQANDDASSESQNELKSSTSESSDSDGSSSDSSSSDSSSDSDSSDSDSDSSDSDSDSKSGSDESDLGDDEEAEREKKMLRWLITPEKLEARARKAALEKEKEKEKVKPPKPIGGGKIKEKQGDDSHRVKKKDDSPEEYTEDSLMKKVAEISQERGRKGFVRKQYLDKLQSLMPHAVKQGPRAQLYILSSMVSADFDKAGSVCQAMSIDYWNEALDKVNEMMPLVLESYKEFKDSGAVETNDDPEDDKTHTRQQELFVAFIEKLDDELYKALQFTVDVYGSEYQDILGNSSKLLILLKRAFKFFEDTEQMSSLSQIALRLMEHLYYKPNMLNAAIYQAIHRTVPEEEKPDWVWPAESDALMAKLCRYAQSAPPSLPVRKWKASLCQAFHLALHDRFQAARDLLQLGNLQDHVAVDSCDIHLQILYNRVLAQMGLCAFRLGKIQDAHTCLMDVCMHNKARELLAQGLSYTKNMERTPEQERAERLRQLPYHMHINLEVLETAHHICAMLLEVPNIAMQSIDPNNKRIISRVLRRHLDTYDRQLFQGPPENAKEAVVSAAKALQRGDWQNACESLEDLKLWSHIDPGNPEAGEKIKEMIKDKIKTEALRTYLFAYASIYDAFHLDQLVGMFGLEAKSVHSIISKMMIKEEITAFWDESSKFVLVQHSEPSPLQRLALTLADKGAQAVDMSEKLVDHKSGGYGFKEQKAQPGTGRWDLGMQGNTSGGRPGRFGGKGGQGQGPSMDDRKGSKGKGRGKSFGTGTGPPRNRGWENARAVAMRGRGWATPART